eukprot:CAMPEP_0119489544 /NCGR_PEP_ID=MMETSP1344-20130328/14961_1 /TAXON_ID=236787 /ORGANISM="Florenciella parvula, Strain CCMP2471" /LENGTH=1189 /DNA_ID=CAMNT_0007524607 /DNA_START=171 /DNA_END=3737 /DNA_ORIENTATION=-
MDWADAYMTDTYHPSTTPAVLPTAFGCHERYDGNNYDDEFEYMCESSNRVQMLVLVLCSSLSFFCTMGLAYICGWDNSLQRNVVWILIADSVSSFSSATMLILVLLGYGSNTFGSGNFHLFFVASVFNAVTKTSQIVATVLSSALGYKMIKYLEEHQRDKEETPGLAPHSIEAGWGGHGSRSRGSNMSMDNSHHLRINSLNSGGVLTTEGVLTTDEEAARMSSIDAGHDVDMDGFNGYQKLGDNDDDCTTPTMALASENSGAERASRLGVSSGGKEESDIINDIATDEEPLPWELWHERHIRIGLAFALLCSVIPEGVMLGTIYGAWFNEDGSSITDDEMDEVKKFPWYLLYGHYARPPRLNRLASMNTVIYACITITFVVWFVVMCWLCRNIIRTGFWRELGGSKKSHETPRTVWLKTLIEICIGFMIIFLVAFMPNVVYLNAQVGVDWRWDAAGFPPLHIIDKHNGSWKPPPYGAWFWIPFNLKGFFDAVFTFWKAKRLILDQPFIAELFGLPLDYEWLREDFDEDLEEYNLLHSSSRQRARDHSGLRLRSRGSKEKPGSTPSSLNHAASNHPNQAANANANANAKANSNGSGNGNANGLEGVGSSSWLRVGGSGLSAMFGRTSGNNNVGTSGFGNNGSRAWERRPVTGGKLLRVRNRKHIENINFKKVGIGLHGHVYRGRYGNRYVSAKVCAGDKWSLDQRNPDWRMIEIELGVLSTAAFDNVVRFDGLFYDPSRRWLYILYEWCPYTLSDLIDGRLAKRGTMNVHSSELGGIDGSLSRFRPGFSGMYSRDKFFALANQLLSAMAFLHEKRAITHQNLKPQNLLLDKSLDLKICDFGWPNISRQMCQSDGDKWDLHLIGTPGYIPPEVLRFHSTTRVGEVVPEEHYDAKQWDSFSTAMVLYYMLERRHPDVSMIEQGWSTALGGGAQGGSGGEFARRLHRSRQSRQSRQSRHSREHGAASGDWPQATTRDSFISHEIELNHRPHITTVVPGATDVIELMWHDQPEKRCRMSVARKIMRKHRYVAWKTAVLAVFSNPMCEQLQSLHTEEEQSVFESPHLRLDYYCKHAITRFDLCTLMPQCKPWCLHFGGHGQLEDFGREFVDALPFHTSLTDQAANPSQVFDTVKPRDFLDMLYPHIFPRGPIELVVLNSCKGEGLARLLHEEAQVPYVIYWKSAVVEANCVHFAQ